ncbi:hypothetical protein SAMN04487970_10332 [Paenibacillus tianmuensis]|uniref:Uncharacterized protein n=1 Tax=Paenibacillus tianmuensis TaxID=624147 RepID=A0A1G4SQE7_9BACL|nr:hypothetical protein SAMN04487970_10332 [Paenibacillus tianmuensis]
MFSHTKIMTLNILTKFITMRSGVLIKKNEVTIFGMQYVWGFMNTLLKMKLFVMRYLTELDPIFLNKYNHY